jgi:thymidylate synthase
VPIYGENQVQRLIRELNENPTSRRHVISLWNIDDLHDMALYPCVWHNQWLVKEGKLHLIVGIRSNDMALGNPFNVFQYYVLQRMIAQVTGYKLGTLTFNINDCHVYERHIEPLKEQMNRTPFKTPKLWINQYVKRNIDEFTIDDFILVNPNLTDFEVQDMDKEEALKNAWYECHPSIKMEVAL